MQHHTVTARGAVREGRARAAGRHAEGEVVADVMSWPATFVGSDAPAMEALSIAEENGVSHLLVVDEADLLGVLCTCDLFEAGPSEPVARWMASPALAVDQRTSLRRAAALMDRHQVGCLPVTGLHLHGIVTRGDLERAGALGDRPVCTNCGSKHHVRQVGSIGFCVECLTRPARDIRLLYEDLGGD